LNKEIYPVPQKGHSREMDEKEIKKFINHLATTEHASTSKQNQALCAIVFLYEQVWHKELGDFTDLA